MAILINPLFSLSAKGKLGGLIYSSNSYGSYVKGYTPQRYKPSPAQYATNYAFGKAADGWRNLTPAEKITYNENARGLQMSGFNLYIKTHFHDFI